MKQSNSKWYVTFHTDLIFRTPNKVYYYAECETEQLAKDVARDLYSLDGVKYLRLSNKINTKGRTKIDMGLWNKKTNEFKNYKWLD